MPSILVDSDRDTILRRIASLTETSQPRWGRFSVGAMLCHLCESTRMALGELPVRSKNMRPFQVFPLKHLLLYALPFPKEAPTAPELLAGQPAEFAADRARLESLLSTFCAGPTHGPDPAHPLFGPLSRQEWGAATYKHTDHHLRQFGA